MQAIVRSHHIQTIRNIVYFIVANQEQRSEPDF